jgi:hypothetical protein
VAAFSEARRGRALLPGELRDMILADEQLSLVEQYRSLDPGGGQGNANSKSEAPNPKQKAMEK